MDLKEIRKKQKITQYIAAQRAGIARAYYTQIEGGLCTPSVKTAKRIARVLGFDWTEFYREEDEDE